MAFSFRGRTLRKVGVIGSGQIGPDIALHFAKVLAPTGTPVVVVDISAEALEAGRAKLEKKVARGVKSGAFKPEQGEQITGNVTFTSDYDELAGADLVVEAATEDERIKGKIFTQLEASCPDDALLLSNSSHLEPEVIFAPIQRKGRTAVVHYFFPAERNRALEIVPGADTDRETTEFLLAFYDAIGKVAVEVQSRYGYAIDPLFEGLLETAAHLVEAGVATSKQVDTVAMRALGLGIGPFTAHNLTGGNPITAHGLAELEQKVNPWFSPPASLLKLVEAGEGWETPARGEEVEVPADVEAKVSDALRATYYGLACEVIDAGLLAPSDLDMLAEIALVIDAPFSAMNRLGTRETLELVRTFAAANVGREGFPVAKCLVAQGESGAPWPIEQVQRRDTDGVAVLTIRRPKVLNALNAEVFAELERKANEIEADDSVQAAVITGHGTKAFVSGADVGFLAKIETPQQGIDTSLNSQRPLNRIQAMNKPVVAALNGLAFGGGNELAMSCTARVCVEGLRVLAGQPEPNLGIIPGAGGTQRLPRLIGLEAAAELLRTGKPISSARAVELGLVREQVPADQLLPRAVELARQLACGEAKAEPMHTGPMPDLPAKLPEVELGHLSRAVDEIIQRVILDGAAMTLEDGLRHEAESFGDVVRTKDMGIGIKNFMTNGPRSKAPFVHE
jgi:enoyl-CoA hydratase / 3-hydroxyacyl-CoA dehydrogenase